MSKTWSWDIYSQDFLNKTIQRCRNKKIILPTFSQLRKPETIPAEIQNKLEKVDLQEINPLNLFRINWRNDPLTGKIGKINFLEIPKSISGIQARIIGLIGKYFPTGAHKVGATYGCLVPYLVTGRFNPEYHKAVWPSTGNYCRGGAFNSALLSVEAVAILPEQMSKERFEWLKSVGAQVFATPGCESNVKEIYDKCHELESESDKYFIFNQFDQFGNSIWHYTVTGSTLEILFSELKNPGSKLAAYVSATGSAGTIAAGDYLKNIFPTVKIIASEALQCPTLLMNGFGAHRIEGIGDKHIPWIHNVKNTDAVTAIDDEEPLRILRLFNEKAGQAFLSKIGVDDDTIGQLPDLGISCISNLISAIKTAKYFELNSNDIVFTIFTDSSELYQSRLLEMNQEWGKYSEKQAEIDYQSVLIKQKTDFFKELSYYEKKSIHNLKYFTWIEQQGKDVFELNAQWYDDEYWQKRYETVDLWDKLIGEFNKKVSV
ncbi:MAG: pyridoxal-phosphate dependent enzyme [Ignavibacteriaceae bacterium]|nr:pyridoxal-phosphate dependent enzyme [Ignavibacteriaceae bacterium]